MENKTKKIYNSGTLTADNMNDKGARDLLKAIFGSGPIRPLK